MAPLKRSLQPAPSWVFEWGGNQGGWYTQYSKFLSEKLVQGDPRRPWHFAASSRCQHHALHTGAGRGSSGGRGSYCLLRRPNLGPGEHSWFQETDAEWMSRRWQESFGCLLLLLSLETSPCCLRRPPVAAHLQAGGLAGVLPPLAQLRVQGDSRGLFDLDTVVFQGIQAGAWNDSGFLIFCGMVGVFPWASSDSLGHILWSISLPQLLF